MSLTRSRQSLPRATSSKSTKNSISVSTVTITTSIAAPRAAGTRRRPNKLTETDQSEQLGHFAPVTRFSIPVPNDRSFKLYSAIDSCGFSRIHPNKWVAMAKHAESRSDSGDLPVMTRKKIRLDRDADEPELDARDSRMPDGIDGYFQRTFHRGDGVAVVVRMWQQLGTDDAGDPLPRVECLCHPPLHSASDVDVIVGQIARMLRLDLDTRPFHNLFPAAFHLGFGRVFRSPTLFEDFVKTITSTNVVWGGTRKMNERLCETAGQRIELPASWNWGVLTTTDSPLGPDSVMVQADSAAAAAAAASAAATTTTTTTGAATTPAQSDRKSAKRNAKAANLAASIEYDPATPEVVYSFPTPLEVLNLGLEGLKEQCRVGYRAESILQLAEAIVNNPSTLSSIEKLVNSNADIDLIKKRVQQFRGIGPYACATIMTCLGVFTHLPVDTVFVKHFRDFHGCRDKDAKLVEVAGKRHYDSFHPFQYLVYWCEVWTSHRKSMTYEQMVALSQRGV
ncbi:hypothetical protein CAOG_08029 [Capsaspora owczarzaki ATCC 30864]|uniref:HhH-GPD domain-containing protein n=1 Tax=Capsaspora owczarzaki (strain ATCC 30864) TaxID=595528 RepID=A0A0D2X5K4_CAPO3|nr:hypothetical protein CAOG_08029 [Capsaspora owczarzaki ATCC 30864]KJE97964.1 hypothetical protein CAOG_008029 [Capsaspora owczarzaki ATCC 30864]|eukprot:XP_004342630.1 hypothetical protein CAOG_08029 [Capsaspora owczarzaki ATCC 30864]